MGESAFPNYIKYGKLDFSQIIDSRMSKLNGIFLMLKYFKQKLWPSLSVEETLL